MRAMILDLIFGAGGVILIVLAGPLLFRRVRPNGLYGFRTPSTIRDERLWYDVNAKTAVDLLVVGLGLLGLTTAHVLEALPENLFPVVAIAWVTVGVIWSALHGFLIIGRSRNREGG